VNSQGIHLYETVIYGYGYGWRISYPRQPWFLADGRTYATVLRLSVVCQSVIVVCTECIVAIWCKSYYWEPIGSRIWEIDWYQNKWPWSLFRGRIKVMSTIALHSTLNILESETVRLEIEAWFQRTTDRKWHMGYPMVTWPMMSRDPQRCCEAVRSAILATTWLLVNVLNLNWQRLKHFVRAFPISQANFIMH